MFISQRINGHYYLATQSRRSQNYLWVMLPHAPLNNGIHIEASEVPLFIRIKAYKLFEGDRKRQGKDEQRDHLASRRGAAKCSPMKLSPTDCLGLAAIHS